jgi:hypothetical protein
MLPSDSPADTCSTVFWVFHNRKASCYDIIRHDIEVSEIEEVLKELKVGM